MKNALQDMLVEIRLRLGSQLKELDVEAKARRKYGGHFVEFTKDDRYVPLDIMLNPAALLPQSLLRLEDCTVIYERWARVDVGTNGWAFYDFMHNRSFRLIGNIEEDFAKISEMIAMLGTVRKPSAESKVTANENLALAFEDIAKLLEPHGNFEVECSSANKVETLSFVDPIDREWRFEFEASRVKALVDGKSVALFAETDRSAMKRLIRSKFEHDTHFSKKW